MSSDKKCCDDGESDQKSVVVNTRIKLRSSQLRAERQGGVAVGNHIFACSRRQVVVELNLHLKRRLV